MTSDEPRQSWNRRQAKQLVRESRALLKRGRKKLTPETIDDIETALGAVSTAVTDGVERAELSMLASDAEALVEKHLAFARKGRIREYTESIGVAVFVALLLRSFLIEAFQIPTGSMEPTLLIGDHLFVAKYAYGVRVPMTTNYLTRWGTPERGDIIVFEFPIDEVQTQVDIGVITRRLEQYRDRNGGYPGELDDLVDPASGRGLSDDERTDSWGAAYAYAPNDDGFSLVSPGRDGTPGTGDDLSAENSAFYGGVDRCLDQDSLRIAKDYIKRVVGLPGDRVRVVGDDVYVNDERFDYSDADVIGRSGPFVVSDRVETNAEGLEYTVRSHGGSPDFAEIIVRDDHVFVMGDNRDRSSDGRCWGQVPIENIKGRAMFIFYSRDRRHTGRIRWERFFDGVR